MTTVYDRVEAEARLFDPPEPADRDLPGWVLPVAGDTEGWLGFLGAAPCTWAAVDELLDDYPEVARDVIGWAVDKHRFLARASEQASERLAGDGCGAVWESFWRGVRSVTDPAEPHHAVPRDDGDPF